MRILMLGNSLTTANDLPAMLGELTGGDVVAHTRGGARLAEHLNPATKLGRLTQAALNEQNWDFLILQEMSHGPATSPAAYLRSATALSELAHSRGITPVVYATWAYAPSCPKLGMIGVTHDEMHRLMQTSFAKAAAAGKALIANVGEAFETASNLEALYAIDGIHPSEDGSRLAAQIIFEALA